MHLHLSLFRGDDNLFFDADSPSRLSTVGRHFAGGLLRYAPEMTLVLNQWVNSYKRLVPGYEAPTFASWAYVNHSDFIRVPSVKPDHPDATRLEVRAPDPACNPYLAHAVLLAAGLAGIKGEMEPPEPGRKAAHEMTPGERRDAGLAALPRDLGEALTLARQSEFLRQTLGDTLFDALLTHKEQEWEHYRQQVTPLEIEQYLPTL